MKPNAVLAMLALASPAMLHAASAQRAWTVEDSVQVRYIAGNQEMPMVRDRVPQPDAAVVLSPDAKYFFFLSYRGELATDKNIFELQVYRVSDVRSWLPRAAGPLAAYRTATVKSDSGTLPGITNAQWDENGEAVWYLGMTSEGVRQVFKLDIASGETRQMTRHPQEIYSFTAGGGCLFLNDIVRKQASPALYPAEAVERAADGSVVVPQMVATLQGRRTTYTACGNEPLKAVREEITPFVPAWVSPHGGFAIAAVGDRERSYILLDMRRGERAWAQDLPFGEPRTQADIMRMPQPQAVWSKDGRRVAMVNARLPSASGVEGGIVEYDTVSRRSRTLKTMPDYFKSSVMFAGGLHVELRQGANEAPHVVASIGKNEQDLLPPDPVIQEAALTSSQVFEWTTQDGEKLSGGLVLPAGAVKGRPLPLVIQTYVFEPKMFLPDGYVPPDAAQALAVQGIATLQIKIAPTGTPDEGPRFVEHVDSAVEALASRGIVDPRRIGMTGFSRSGYQTYYAITHTNRFVPAAAVCADNFTAGYPSYLQRSAINFRYGLSGFETMPAGTFWDKKAEWLRHETSFNVDRVRTPALFTRHGIGIAQLVDSGPTVMEVLGAFVRNNRPVEYLFFPKGDHFLVRPKETAALKTAVVDWMSFWLQDKIPADAERAARWKVLRGQQDEVLKQPVKPKTKWIEVPAGS